MFNKRLLKKFSFVVLLCIIPAVAPIMHSALTQDAGILTIAIASEDDSPAAVRAQKHLINSESIVVFIQCDNAEDAGKMVADYKADAAWIFRNNLEKRINNYIMHQDNSPFVRVIEREETNILKLSKEVLYGAIYNEVSIAIYSNHARATLENTDNITEAEFRTIYNNMERNGQIIEISRLSSDAEIEKNSYLTNPIRGILAILVVFAALAASMYYLKDLSEGKYDWLPSVKRIIPAFALCFSASLLASLAVFLSIIFSGNIINIFREFLCLVMFSLSAASFSLIFCMLFKSYGKLGALLPGILVIILVFSPIFFNVDVLGLIKLMLPTYYYLYSLYDNLYFVYCFIYIFFFVLLSVFINFLKNRNATKSPA